MLFSGRTSKKLATCPFNLRGTNVVIAFGIHKYYIISVFMDIDERYIPGRMAAKSTQPFSANIPAWLGWHYSCNINNQ